MHMADALLAPSAAAAMYTLSTAAAAVSIAGLRRDEPYNVTLSSKKLPVMAVMSALVFAGQMINYTIPGTGSSGHLCGGLLLSSVLGPFGGFLCMIAVLAIQCLFFADGGLLALGANVWNMAFYGCFVGYFLIYRPIMRSRLFASRGDKAGRYRLIAASVLGCVLTLQLGAFSVVLETSLSGITELPFGAFLALMQPIHLAIGLVEGLITAAVLVFVYEARPELIRENAAETDRKGMTFGAALGVLLVVAVVVGGGMSRLASTHPDGLEWSLFGNEDAGYAANMALDEDNYGIASQAGETAASIQEKTAVLPDYAFTSDPEDPLGTSASGLVGIAIVGAVVMGIGGLGKVFRRKRPSKAGA